MIRRGVEAAALAVLLSSPFPLSAQAPPSPPGAAREALTSTYHSQFLRDLPTSDNLFAVIETLQPSIASDRFAAGGLSIGQPARLGGFLASWTQTQFRLEGVPFTDPTGNGAPLLFPDMAFWGSLRVGTGAFGAGTNTEGLEVDLRPLIPGDRWTGAVEGSFSHGRLTAQSAGLTTPTIGHVEVYDRASVMASGPVLRDRLGATFAVSGTNGSLKGRGDPTSVRTTHVSAFSRLLFTPSPVDAVRVVAWGQQSDVPLGARAILRQPTATSRHTSGRVQVAWDRGLDGPTAWHLSTSATERQERPDAVATGEGMADRLVDGPMSQFASLADRRIRAWSVEARVAPRRLVAGRPHRLTAGLDVEGGELRSAGFFSGTIGELVHESPARVWRFSNPGTTSDRRTLTLAADLHDQMALTDRVTLGAGLRVESVEGSASGATHGVAWRTALPRASAQWTISERAGLTAFGAYSRSASRLALDDLAVGDPAAPTAEVFRWNALAGLPLSLADRGALVARAGPGTGGDPGFTSIDPDLKRPTSDELVLSIEAAPSPRLLLRLAGVARRERHLAGVINVGAPASTSYTSFVVTDPSANLLGPEDDKVLPVYNRIPSSFGRDRYVLTTPGHAGSRFQGVELTFQVHTARFTLSGGATAGTAQTFAAAVGAGPTENDQMVLGDFLTNPNAGTLSRGRPFTDRGYTAKMASVVRLPWRLRVGLVVRYQDGRPFSRVLVFPGLTQGADAVRTFSNGESRLRYVATLDGRLQKTFTIGGCNIDGFVDVYNLPNLANSVDEQVAGAPNVRVATAVQPARSVQLGFRVAF